MPCMSMKDRKGTIKMNNGKYIKVVKFGGSSLADGEHFRKVAAIVKAEPERKYVIPSAPGKRFAGDEKVTDMLYQCYDLSLNDKDYSAVFDKIKERYNLIIADLGLDLSLDDEYEAIDNVISERASRDYVASRGEYLNGLILSAFLGFEFVDADSVIYFDEKGHLDDEKTNQKMRAALKKCDYAVIPGFYGSACDGSIKTFSRGGSDITGSIVARAVDADLYENWTDVSGFKMVDPRIVPDAKTIDVITYSELRELAYMGATVLHEDAIFPVRLSGIPINIRNTNKPEKKGTMIVLQAPADDVKNEITGIAGRKGFSVINIGKDMMNSEVGFGRRVLSILERYGVSFEHIPSGIDSMGIIVTSAALNPSRDMIMHDLSREIIPDFIHIEDDIALVSVVGRGMVQSVGIAARIFKAIGEAGINIRMIDQGSTENNIIIGIREVDFETTIKAIYDEFAG